MTLEIITSDALAPLRHGFFTRRGGASSGVFAGLNCGLGSSDQAEVVAINRQRVCDALQVTPSELISIFQLHSTTVHVITSARQGGNILSGDAMVTKTPGLALCVLSADCQPVLLADHTARVIGAAHAGWRGALAGVLEATLSAMEGLGATRTNISAVVGPAISQRAYEVGPEFLDDFITQDPENSRFFANGDGDRMLFDLPGFGLHRLRAAGIGRAEWTRHCTFSDPDRFFSYRRGTHAKEADYGRLLSGILL
ncbi:MAG: peptidoglycan editing factor PgeF [Paracoccaceae bacterium]